VHEASGEWETDQAAVLGHACVACVSYLKHCNQPSIVKWEQAAHRQETDFVTGSFTRRRRFWPWMKSMLGRSPGSMETQNGHWTSSWYFWTWWRTRSSPPAVLILGLSGIGGATNFVHMAYDHVLEVGKGEGSTRLKGFEETITVRDVLVRWTPKIQNKTSLARAIESSFGESLWIKVKEEIKGHQVLASVRLETPRGGRSGVVCQWVAFGSPRRSRWLRHQIWKEIPWLKSILKEEQFSCWTWKETGARFGVIKKGKVDSIASVSSRCLQVEDEHERLVRLGGLDGPGRAAQEEIKEGKKNREKGPWRLRVGWPAQEE